MTSVVQQRCVAVSVWGVGGGAFSNVAVLLAKGLLASGVDVDIVHLNADQPAKTVEFHDGVRVVPLNASRSIRSIIPLARYLQNRDPSALISIGWMQNSPAVLAKLLSRWKGVLLLSIHGLERQRGVRSWALPSISRLLYPTADALVAVSDEVLLDMVERVGISPTELRMRVIPNAIDVDDVRRRGREDVEHAWIHEKGHRLVVSVGRLAEEKNQKLLLEALAKIRESVDARLILLGEGPERANLARMIRVLGLSDAVSMPGFVFNPMPYLARADVFALSSQAEGWGLALMEAMAIGCPVVATSVGGVPELLQHGHAGAMVAGGDVTALSDALMRVLSDDTYRRGLVDAGIRRVSELTPERVATMWLSCITEAERTRDPVEPRR